MYSMTGYGKGCIERDGRKVTIELKAVNHRYLDLAFRMPKLFLFAEDALRKTISTRLQRGHIDVYVSYEDNRTDKESLTLNEAVVNNYVGIARTLQNSFGITNDLTASAVLRLNDVLTVRCAEEDEALLLKLVTDSAVLAIDEMQKMRAAEGANTAADMLPKLQLLQDKLAAVKQRAPLIPALYRERLTARLAELSAEVPVDPSRLVAEVALFSDKCSIDEEMERFTSHIVAFSTILHGNEPCGKKLDFLLQEMNREVNTMGSKANDLTITTLVVEMKNELEKIREQVQNLE